jgi:hypothetical protein
MHIILAVLGASVHLFGRGDEVLAKPQDVLQRSLEQFTPQQIQSMMKLINHVANAEGKISPAQTKLIAKIQSVLPQNANSTW